MMTAVNINNSPWVIYKLTVVVVLARLVCINIGTSTSSLLPKRKTYSNNDYILIQEFYITNMNTKTTKVNRQAIPENKAKKTMNKLGENELE